MSLAAALPASMIFIERDWLSSNNVLFVDGDEATLVDSGYFKHQQMTLALVSQLLAQHGNPRLTRLVNTHLHSDHCGANALLAAEHGCRVLVPASQAQAVVDWDQEVLSYAGTGQYCPRFIANGTVSPGDELTMGGARWTAHAAPGHDPHSLVYHCAEHRLLISADALWENGFGVIFPEMYGQSGFAEQQAILDLIESLPVERVMPGHGAMFTDVPAALGRARSRLAAFRADPVRHARASLKALIKFKLIEDEQMPLAQMVAFTERVPIMANAARQMDLTAAQAVQRCVDEMVGQSVIRRDGELLLDR